MGGSFVKSCIPVDRDDPNLPSPKSDTFVRDQRLQTTTTIELISLTIRDYFSDERNVCEHESEAYVQSILDNIFILGNTPRDYLLKRPIQSIDIALNTRELTKLQEMHLRKHHNTEEKQKEGTNCILWALYLSKYIDDNYQIKVQSKPTNKHSLKKYAFIADCDYIINAQFIVHCILDEFDGSLFGDNISIYRDEEKKIFEISILDSCIENHNQCALDGVKFNVFDVSEHISHFLSGTIYKPLIVNNKQLQKSGMNEMFQMDSIDSRESTPSLRPLTAGMYDKSVDGNAKQMPYVKSLSMRDGGQSKSLRDEPSLRMIKLAINDQIVDSPTSVMNDINNKTHKRKKKNRAITIDIPFYEAKLREILKSVDFSINTLQIKMSSVLALYDEGDGDDDGDGDGKDNDEEDFDDSSDEKQFMVVTPNTPDTPDPASPVKESNNNAVSSSAVPKYSVNNSSSNPFRNDGSLNDGSLNNDWDAIIENGLEEYDALLDFKGKRLTHPNAICKMEADKYFWSLIRFSVVLRKWKIDDKLVQIHKENLDKWMLSDAYWKSKNKLTNTRNDMHFVNMVFKHRICRKYKHFKRMLEVFDLLDINKKIRDLMQINQSFKRHFEKELANLPAPNVGDQSIRDLFSDYGYSVSAL